MEYLLLERMIDRLKSRQCQPAEVASLTSGLSPIEGIDEYSQRRNQHQILLVTRGEKCPLPVCGALGLVEQFGRLVDAAHTTKQVLISWRWCGAPGLVLVVGGAIPAQAGCFKVGQTLAA